MLTRSAELDIDELEEAVDSGFTPPAEWYLDPSIYPIEVEQIFHRTWQYAGRATDISEPGSYFTRTIGEIPTLVVRDREGEVRAYVNVCRHRFYQVAEGKGSCHVLQCRYHGWTYGLDGRLLGAPHHAMERGFDKSGHSLLPMRVDTMNGLIFVNGDLDAAPLSATVGDLPHLMIEHGFDLAALKYHSKTEFPVAANWKVYMENASECYHCPTVHPNFSQTVVVDPDVLSETLFPFCYSMNSRLKNQTGDADHAYRYQFYYIWPNTIFAPHMFPRNGNAPFARVLVFRPTGLDSCVIECEVFHDGSLDDEEFRSVKAFAWEVMEEDRVLAPVAHRGIASQRLRQGRIMVANEELIQHWYRLYCAAIKDHVVAST